MAGFRKAKPEQAALKMAVYGPPGSGKTCLALLIAEGLAKKTGKRVAFVDTERGTDFYAQPNKAREWHPTAFDFDALYSRSLTEIDASIRKLKPDEHCCVVLDSMTHLWEAARASYSGRTGPDGQIPMPAWAKIKKPYKDLVAFLLSSPLHVIICGRQGTEFDEDENGKMTKVGFKMKAEGETAYEPHVLIRLESVRQATGVAIPTAFIEKDRSSCLYGKVVEWPSFKTIAEPILHLLGDTQATVQTEAQAAVVDAAVMAEADAERERVAATLMAQFRAKIASAKSGDELDAISKEITPAVKELVGTAYTAELRQLYTDKRALYK